MLCRFPVRRLYAASKQKRDWRASISETLDPRREPLQMPAHAHNTPKTSRFQQQKRLHETRRVASSPPKSTKSPKKISDNIFLQITYFSCETARHVGFSCKEASCRFADNSPRPIDGRLPALETPLRGRPPRLRRLHNDAEVLIDAILRSRHCQTLYACVLAS